MGVVHRWAVTAVVAVAALGVIVGAAGCSSGDGGGSEAEPATVEGVLAAAAQAMAGVETAHFTITRSGAEVFIDDGDQFRFDEADGRYARPSSADAVITVNALGFTTQVAAVVIDGEVFLTNPLTGTWEAAPEDFTFDPATLFAPDTGWQSLLAGGLTDAQLLDDGDAERHHVRATVGADRVAVLTGGLVEEASTVDLWIDRDSDRVVELAFDATVDGATSTWRMTLDEYGADVDITQPSVGARN